MRLRYLLVILLWGIPLASQTGPATALPKIHFIFDHPGLPVTHYELDVDARGSAHYESKFKAAGPGTADDGITRDFTLSPETRDRIFVLAKAAGDLDGSFDFTKRKIAFTGTKTITLTDIKNETHTAKFVWSENEHLIALSELLQGISGTLEEEPVLQRLRRYDRLGLNAELEKMEKAAGSGWLRELNLIANTLKDIASDPSVMGVARKRAARLFQKASPSAHNEN